MLLDPQKICKAVFEASYPEYKKFWYMTVSERKEICNKIKSSILKNIEEDDYIILLHNVLALMYVKAVKLDYIKLSLNTKKT